MQTYELGINLDFAAQTVGYQLHVFHGIFYMILTFSIHILTCIMLYVLKNFYHSMIQIIILFSPFVSTHNTATYYVDFFSPRRLSCSADSNFT